MIINNFNVIGKKNNQTAVFHADREGKRIMPETRFTEFTAFSVDPRVGISRSASETGDRFYLSILERLLRPGKQQEFISRYEKWRKTWRFTHLL